MTDYSHLDYPNNSFIKRELIKLIDLLNEHKIHYWVDFAYLKKITEGKNDKFLYYLNCFEICVFEESFNKINKLLTERNFTVWDNSDKLINISARELYILNMNSKFTQSEILIQGLLKWIIIWNMKDVGNNMVSLNMQKDFIYNKELFTEVEEIEYCGIKLNIPKHRELIFKIRYPSNNGVVFCHSPKKRENCEKEYGFCNLGNYK